MLVPYISWALRHSKIGKFIIFMFAIKYRGVCVRVRVVVRRTKSLEWKLSTYLLMPYSLAAVVAVRAAKHFWFVCYHKTNQSALIRVYCMIWVTCIAEWVITREEVVCVWERERDLERMNKCENENNSWRANTYKVSEWVSVESVTFNYTVNGVGCSAKVLEEEEEVE